VDRKLTFEDDTSLPQSYGIGFTNLTSRVSRRATDLTIDEQRANVPQLTQKIRQYRPKWVAFVGMGIYQIYSGQRKVEAGLQNTTIAWQQGTGGSKVYVMPSTSGLVAAYHKKDKMK
jgi:TDG/mug DNA glycosylase family protein